MSERYFTFSGEKYLNDLITLKLSLVNYCETGCSFHGRLQPGRLQSSPLGMLNGVPAKEYSCLRPRC